MALRDAGMVAVLFQIIVVGNVGLKIDISRARVCVRS